MHPISFVGRALPGPTGGAYSAPPGHLAGFKGPTSKEGEGRDGSFTEVCLKKSKLLTSSTFTEIYTKTRITGRKGQDNEP